MFGKEREKIQSLELYTLATSLTFHIVHGAAATTLLQSPTNSQRIFIFMKFTNNAFQSFQQYGGTSPPQAPNVYYNPHQPPPQVIYVERPQQRESNNDWWLTSLLALCCGCCLGELLCDSPCLCCVLPCPPLRLPRFR